MNFTVYILKSQKDNSFYVGVTNNLIRRVNEHQKGLSKSTKNKVPWQLVYQEKFDTIKSAYHREKEIKSRKKRKYIESLILRARSSAG
jgi:putative endonuclease